MNEDGERVAKRMGGVIERGTKRPGREDKPCLLCLDISVSLLGVNTPIHMSPTDDGVGQEGGDDVC